MSCLSVMGRVLKLGITFQLVRKDDTLMQEVYKLAEMTKQSHVKPWERRHAHAVLHVARVKQSLFPSATRTMIKQRRYNNDTLYINLNWTELHWWLKHFCYLCFYRQIDKASSIWEDILVENPLDMLSLKFANDMYVVNGISQGFRDTCARVLPYWNSSTPLYGYFFFLKFSTVFIIFFNHSY